MAENIKDNKDIKQEPSAKAKDSKNVKPKKEKKPSKIMRSLKETGSELKKVTWPKASTVAKQTGVVLVVVAIFTVVIFGMDRLLGLLYELLISAVG